jgi:hypothetical protein
MNKQMKIVLITLIVLSSSISVAYAMNPSLATFLQDIVNLLTTHDSDVQVAVSTLQSSVDALPRTEYVQGYEMYTLTAGDIPMIYSSPTYPGGAHVSLTILDPSLSPGDSIIVSGSITDGAVEYTNPMAELSYRTEGYSSATTFEFNCESWFIYLFGDEGSVFDVYYSATVTYIPVT